jgi:hypothetical protein
LRWLKLKCCDLLLIRGQNFGRQTDGLGFVISTRAVTKVDLHRRGSFVKRKVILIWYCRSEDKPIFWLSFSPPSWEPPSSCWRSASSWLPRR